MVKAVIFDMNGVFVKDAGPLSVRLQKTYGIPVDDVLPLIKSVLKAVRNPGADSRKIWQPVLDKTGLSYDELFHFWFDGESLNEPLIQLAKELKKRNISVIILSNNFPERTNNYRRLFPELFKVVDEEYFSWETGHIKPSPEAYTQILNRHQFAASEYIYFDDNDEYLAAASTLGIISHRYVDLPDTIQFINLHLDKKI